jgi:hypothetical protein
VLYGFTLNDIVSVSALLISLIIVLRNIFYNKTIQEKIVLFKLFLYASLIFPFLFLFLAFVIDLIATFTHTCIEGCGLGVLFAAILLVFFSVPIVVLILLLYIPILIQKFIAKEKKKAMLDWWERKLPWQKGAMIGLILSGLGFSIAFIIPPIIMSGIIILSVHCSRT